MISYSSVLSRSTICCTVLGALLFVGGCSTSDKNWKRDPLKVELVGGGAPQLVQSVVIMPLVRALNSSVSDEQLQELSSNLVSAFDTYTSLSVVNITEKENTAAEMLRVKSLAISPKDQALRLAKQLNVDAVIYGTVSDLREADGSRLGSSAPGRAAYTLKLLEAKNARDIWSASFEKSEKAISENVLQLSQAVSGGIGFKDPALEVKKSFVRAAQDFEEHRRGGK